MKRQILILSILIVSSSVLNGCSKYNTKAASIISSKPQYAVQNNEDISHKYFAPFTGEEVPEYILNNPPFMVIIENSKAARPQSGLSEADIVFETMAEGGIPRFIALFQKNNPKEIGPVRSARPYFIDIAKEYSLPFGHCGGSEEALICIKNEELMSMNEMNNGSFYWRDKSRQAPHNLYTSGDKLRKLLAAKGFIQTSSFKHKFNSEYWQNNTLSSANSIVINLNRYYTVEYNLKNNQYFKTMDKVPAVDKFNNKQLSVSNIIVQITDIKLKDDGSHVDVALVGSGSGYVISNGRFTKANWNKENTSSPTIFTDEKGNVIPLSPGKTWWHITDRNLNIIIK